MDRFIKEQATALKFSEFRDFEWVVVDDLYDDRKELLTEAVGGEFPLTHTNTPDRKPYFNTVEALHTAIRHSRGELIFWMIDYVFIHKETLGRHWKLYQEYPNAFFSGRSVEVDTTPEELFKGGVHRGGDYRMGLFSNSIFQRRWINEEIFEVFPDGVINWWAGRNDSCPMEAVLKCNGFDHELDGFHGYQDSDLAQRMMRAGYRYLIDNVSVVLEFPHSSARSIGVRTETEHQELAARLGKQRERGKIYWVNEWMNLRKERDECLKSLS